MGTNETTDGDQQSVTVTVLAPLKLVAAILALFTAAIHLSWGWERFVWQVQELTVPDPRPILFVVSAAAIVVGLTLVAVGAIDTRTAYLGGIIVALCYLLGYVAWHTLLGHGAIWPWSPLEYRGHSGNPVGTLVGHLTNQPLEGISKLIESILLVVLAVLYRLEGRLEAGAK